MFYWTKRSEVHGYGPLRFLKRDPKNRSRHNLKSLRIKVVTYLGGSFHTNTEGNRPLQQVNGRLTEVRRTLKLSVP